MWAIHSNHELKAIETIKSSSKLRISDFDAKFFLICCKTREIWANCYVKLLFIDFQLQPFLGISEARNPKIGI